MHVAICSDGVFPEAIGGMERHTRLLTETIAARHPGVRVTVVHTHPGKRIFPALPNVDEVAVEPRPGRRQYILECLDLSARFAEALERIPDAVVYSQGVCVLRHIRNFTHRLVVNPHGLESFQTLTIRQWAASTPFRTIQRHTFRHARHVVSLGGRLTDILGRECRGAPGKVVVLPNGVDVPAAAVQRPAAKSDGPIRLLFVGRLVANKGVPDLLSAIEILSKTEPPDRYVLDIVGSGPLLEQLKATNTLDSVQFRQKVGDQELEKLYASADALVLPTLFEGMPTVVLEAMARAVPVLVTDVGASRELVDSSNGEIIPKRDPQALANALRRLHRIGPDARQRLGAAGRARALARFTWARVADAHVDLFRSMAP